MTISCVGIPIRNTIHILTLFITGRCKKIAVMSVRNNREFMIILSTVGILRCRNLLIIKNETGIARIKYIQYLSEKMAR